MEGNYGSICTITTTAGYSLEVLHSDGPSANLVAQQKTVVEVTPFVEIYPNPLNASDKLTINTSAFHVQEDNPGQLKLYDVLGKELLHLEIRNPLLQLDLPGGIVNGIYFISIEASGQKVTRKFIVQ